MITQTAKPQNLTFPDEDFRTQQPPAAAPRPFRLPTMKPFTLKNGIKVYLEQQSALFREAPAWLHRLVGSPQLLKWAAGKAALSC